MDLSTKIKTVCTAVHISEAELARRIGTTPSAFNQRLKTGRFTSDEIVAIADALGCEYSSYFTLPDGTKI